MSKNRLTKLNTNLPRPGTVHQSYEERYINQGTSAGNLWSTRDFSENDPVWVKISKHGSQALL